MDKIVLWIVILLGVFMAYQAGWLNGVLEYFGQTKNYGQERVIEEEDGTISTIRYRNIVDIMTGK